MKKLIATLLAAAMMLTCAALAATYDEDGIFFEYDDAVFEITLNERSAESATVILNAKDEALEHTFINISLEMPVDGEALPTVEDFAEAEEIYHTKVEQIGEWLGFKDVSTFTYDPSDEYSAWHAEEFFVPIADGDTARAVLDIFVCADTLADEEAGIAYSDAMSAVLDSLKVSLDETMAEGADSD